MYDQGLKYKPVIKIQWESYEWNISPFLIEIMIVVNVKTLCDISVRR